MSPVASVRIATGSGRARPLLVVAALMLASFTVGLDTRNFSLGLSDLRGAFDLGVDEASWLNTFAAAPQILLAPAVPWLVSVFGVRRVMIWPCLIYAVVSFLIPQIYSFEPLVALHILRAMMLGIFIPATIMITLRNLDMRFWIVGLAIYSLRVPLSQNVSVFLVGFYTEHLGLQWLYWQDVFLTPLVAFLIILGAVREPVDRKRLASADWGGMLLLGSSMALIYIGLDQGNRLDWFESATVTMLIVAGGLLAVLFLVNESLVRDPWAHASILASRNLLLGLATIIAYIAASTTTFLIIPGFLENVVALRPVEIGNLYIPAAIIPLFCAVPLAAAFLRCFDARWGLMIGFSLMGVSSLLATSVTGAWALGNFTTIIVLQVIGQGFALLSAITFNIANADPSRSTSSAAYVQVVRLVGAELAATLILTFITKREQFHSNILGLHVTKASEATERALHALVPVFQRSSETPTTDAVVTIAQRVSEQAHVLAYADAFRLAFYAAIIGLVLTSLMKASPKGPLSPRW